MAASSSGTPSLVSLSLPAQSSKPMAVDKQAALEELAKKARIAQLAAQLRLRLSYTGYKATNKLATVPFATLEKRLEEEMPTPKAAPAVLLLDPSSLAGDRSRTDTQLMPPPPAPAQSLYVAPSSNSLYSSILDADMPERPTKRQKVDANGGSRAFAPSPAFLIESRKDTSSNSSAEKKKSTPSSSQKSHGSTSKSRTSAQKLHKATLKASPRKKSAGKKTSGVRAKDVFAMAPSEQEAAETLASFLFMKGSPNSGKRPSGSAKSSSSVISSSMVISGNDGAKALNKKGVRRTPSLVSMSSIDAAMADANLSTSGVDTTTADGSGVDTVPGSPVPSTGQATVQGESEKDVADVLLLFSQSPSPARNAARRAPIANVEGRVLFTEGSGTSEGSGVGEGKDNAISRASSGSSLPGGTGAVTGRTPSLLLPPPPSPSKKSSSTKATESYTIHPFVTFPPSANPPTSSLGQPQLQAPFTPGSGGAYFNPSASFSSSNPFGGGFTLGLGGMTPSTPGALSFNMADYINFTPTPGGGLSPAQKGSAKNASAQAQAMQGMAMGPGMPLMQSLFAGGYGGSPGMPIMGPVMSAAPKKEGERKRKKAGGNTTATASGARDGKTPTSSSSASQTPVSPAAYPKGSGDASKAPHSESDASKLTPTGTGDHIDTEKKEDDTEMETGR